MNETVIIHSRRLAIYLQCRGFILFKVEPDLKTKRKVFIFKESDRIQKAILEYKTDVRFNQLMTAFK
ncbi:DUF5659 domain-containing protein [Bacillaceae bacterium C204]|uniref:DUF5659 domain-containing protein n=1 Tax=Neobacillus sp. 204 TaxID=3383351 RepID=UPI003978377C